MKKQDTQFEDNVSRLVKSTRDKQVPPEAFTRGLVEAGLQELKTRQPGRRWARRLVPVAALLVVAAGLFGLVLPSLRVAKLSFKAPAEGDRILAQNARTAADNQSLVMEAKEFANRVSPPPPPPPPASPQPAARPLAARRALTSKGDVYYYADVVTVSDSEAGLPMAHGGTTPPNNAAYDAMFFKHYGVNPFVDTEDDHLSTFAVDVDSGSYTLCRRYLREGNLPPSEAVRVEEFVNYFDYEYPAPQAETFAVFMEAMPWAFGRERRNSVLLRVGIKGMEIAEENRKPAVLTFVIDVSGSMDWENRLGLVKQSLEMLVERLRPEDRIGIAVYGSRGSAVLEHTGLEDRSRILDAIRSLQTEGATNAEEGIAIGYRMAEEAFAEGHINRVILCSDGVANVGRTGPDQILEVIKKQADKGITLSALGFGMGNYNDVLMERLGDKGNGYYAYVDTLDEARRLFGKNLTGTLQVIARDVKIQVDFNPEVVRSYRLIGYENRDVADQDFRNDTVDGGEIGAGHAVTALYELKLWPEGSGSVATTYIRYKDPDTFEVSEINRSFEASQMAEGFDTASRSFALASVVTEFAEVLRESYWAKGADLKDTLQRVRSLGTEYPADEQIAELADLIAGAERLRSETPAASQSSRPDAVPLGD